MGEVTLPLNLKRITMSDVSMHEILNSVISKGAANTLLLGGKKTRGPIKTAELIYECMVGVSLELTERLPEMFEQERQKYEQQKKYLTLHGNKGKYTNSYGWSKKREIKLDFSLSPTFHNYFKRIIVPFLGGESKGWADENSKIWKKIRKMIVSGDKVEIIKLQRNIRNQILKESNQSAGANLGTNNTKSSEGIITESSSI